MVINLDIVNHNLWSCEFARDSIGQPIDSDPVDQKLATASNAAQPEKFVDLQSTLSIRQSQSEILQWNFDGFLISWLLVSG